MNVAIKLILTLLCALPLYSWAGTPQKANEKVVLDYIEAMDRATANAAVDEVPKIVEKFWTENCDQHRTGVAPGRAGVITALQGLPMFAKPSSAPTASAPFKTLSITSKEDRVILIRRRVETDPTNPSKTTERYVFNVYRIEGGKIAENWWAMAM
jgi:predicted SnoaL-like aldol condensation-catalyzing enzyme